MVSLAFVYLSLVFLLALAGALRGWAKEILVTFGMVLAIFLITIFEQFVPVIRDYLNAAGTVSFVIRAVIIFVILLAAYQTPSIPRLQRGGGDRFRRASFPDTLLGFFLGLLNGYLIVGTLWYYLHAAGYPFNFVSPPDPNLPGGQAALQYIAWLPPQFLSGALLYVVFALLAIIVLVIFV